MKHFALSLSYLLLMSLAASADNWALERCPTPIWAQPEEVLELTLTGPAGQTGSLQVGPKAYPLCETESGRYLARVPDASPGEHRLTLALPGGQSDLGEIQIASGLKTFDATSTVVVRQGPDSDFERLTPLVPGAQVPVNGRRGDWYRSADTGAWLDGRSGKLLDTPAARPRLTRVKVDSFPNGDARITLSCGTVPETRASLGSNGLILTLAGTDDLLFDLTKDSESANFLGPITVVPLLPNGVEVQVATAAREAAGFALEPGEKTGDLVLRVRRPLARTLKGLIVTVDAGHGGAKDPGTVGHRGLPEKVLNLRVAQSLERMLKEKGAQVVMTRTGDYDVAPEEKGASHELQSRVELSEAAGSHVFLSLHHNARPDVEEGKTFHGTDIYWYQPFSEPLARALADPVADAVGEPLRTSRYRSFHVIRQSFSPSVLIEFQYLSNPALEASVLDQPEYPDKAAAGVVKGLESFLENLP
jgi:N-acetylmuramoyl-L-alanine amidase